MLSKIFKRKETNSPVATLLPGQTTKTVAIGGTEVSLTGWESDPYFKDLPSHIQALSPLYTVVNAVCPQDGVIIDVGANIGVSGILMSLINPQGSLICIEPSQKNFQLLENNLAVNAPRAVAVRSAIGSEDGTVSFHESNLCGAWNHVSNERHLGDSDATTTVPLTTLDNIVRLRALERVDFVKIDVEGFETHVLAGMKQTVERFNPVVHIEINSVTTILEGGRSPRDLLADFIALMGNVYAYGPNDVLEPLDTTEKQRIFIYRNLVERGCIDDVVGCRDASRLASLL